MEFARVKVSLPEVWKDLASSERQRSFSFLFFPPGAIPLGSEGHLDTYHKIKTSWIKEREISIS